MNLLYLHQWTDLPEFLHKIKQLPEAKVLAAILVEKKEGFEEPAFLNLLKSQLPRFVEKITFYSYEEFLEELNWNKAELDQFEFIYSSFSIIRSPLEHKLLHQIFQNTQKHLRLYEEETKSFTPIFRTAEQMEKTVLIEHACELVKSGNFAACRKLLAGQIKNKDLVRVLTFGEHLLRMNFETDSREENGFSLLADWLDNMEAKEEAAYIKQLQRIQHQEQKPFIWAVHNYAEWLYEQEDLIDFIVLYYRLAEETLLYAIGWDAKPRSQGVILRNNALFYLSLPKDKISNHYHRYLQQLKREIRKVEERKGVIIRRNKCRGLEVLNQRERYFTDLYLFFQQKSFEDFLDLRHEGVSGHGFADFTKEMFQEILDGQEPLHVMNSLLETLDLKPPHSIFKIVQKVAIGMIQSDENALNQHQIQ